VDNGGANQTTWGRKIPTPTSFGSAPPLSASEFGALRHGFFNSVGGVGGRRELRGRDGADVDLLVPNFATRHPRRG
jgi:hypothetical protein